MSLGEWFQLAVWDVKAFLGDKDAAVHAESVREVNAQKSPEDKQIFETVESAKIEHEGVMGLLDNIGNTVRGLWRSGSGTVGGFFKTLSFSLRFFPLILLGFAALYVFFILKPFKKVSP